MLKGALLWYGKLTQVLRYRMTGITESAMVAYTSGLGMHLVTYSNHDTVLFLLIVPIKGRFV